MSETPAAPRLAETFAEVEDALLSRWPETRLEPSLDRIRAFTELLGDPQRRYPADPPHRHQRQDVDVPDDRHAAARARAAHRPLHQPPRGADERADLRRRRAADRRGVRARLQRRRAVHPPRRRGPGRTRCPSSRPWSGWRTPRSPTPRSTWPSSRSGMGGSWDATNVADADGGRGAADRGRPRAVPRRHRRSPSPRRRPGSSSPARSRCSPSSTPEVAELLVAARRRGRGDRRPRGHGVRRGLARPGGGRPGRLAAGAAGAVRRGLPAALRRPPGAERRGRAGRGRGLRASGERARSTRTWCARRSPR